MEQDKEWTLSFNVKHWCNKPLKSLTENDFDGYCEAEIVLPNVWNQCFSEVRVKWLDRSLSKLFFKKSSSFCKRITSNYIKFQANILLSWKFIETSDFLATMKLCENLQSNRSCCVIWPNFAFKNLLQHSKRQNFRGAKTVEIANFDTLQTHSNWFHVKSATQILREMDILKY